jgi:hypothetical protein
MIKRYREEIKMEETWIDPQGSVLKWTEETKGKELVGTLTEKRLTSTGSMIYSMLMADGTVTKFWGTMVLDDLLVPVDIGCKVKVKYLGTIPGKKAGTKCHKFDVKYQRLPVQPSVTLETVL